MCFLQDDIVKLVSESASPPRLVEIPEEGKGKAKERREVGEGATLLSSKTHRTKMMRKRFKSGSSCGRDSAALDCPTSLSSKILQLTWRLVCLRRRGSRATWHASAWPRSSRSLRPHPKR
jgi:hypothetical protein